MDFLVFRSEYFDPKWTKFHEERDSGYMKMAQHGKAGGKQIKRKVWKILCEKVY